MIQGVGGTVFQSVCVALEAPVEGSLRAREQRVHGLDTCCPVFDVFYLLQAQ